MKGQLNVTSPAEYIAAVDDKRRALPVAARLTIRMCHRDGHQQKFPTRRRALSHGKRRL